MSLDEAITLLKKIVKYSNIPGQKHIDFSLANADEIETYQLALMVSQKAVSNGEISRDELLNRLNLT